MEFLKYIEWAVGVYVGGCVVYTFICSLAGSVSGMLEIPLTIKGYPHKIAVLIPAYQEDSVIVRVAADTLRQSYPGDLFDVVVIGDGLQPATVRQLRQLPIEYVEVQFEKSTKVKALNKAMELLHDNYDIALVLDADNIMERHYLRKINALFNRGHRVVQTNRKAKNTDSPYAILDALSEMLNNHIYRKGQTALGLSCSLTGSAMAFDYTLFKNTMKDLTAVGGFDRELEIKLIEQGKKAVYFEGPVVYDEKTSSSRVFSKQRQRWIASQFHYLRKYFIKGALSGNMVYLNSTVLRNILLPRVLLLGTVFALAVLGVFLNNFLFIPGSFWLALCGLYVLSLLMALPLRFYNKNSLKALLYLPQAFMIMLLILFKLRHANKEFIHTPHGQTNL